MESIFEQIFGTPLPSDEVFKTLANAAMSLPEGEYEDYSVKKTENGVTITRK